MEIGRETIRALVADALELSDPELLDDDAGFGRMPEWDSLGHIRVMHALTEAFGTTIDAEAIERTLTLSKIETFIGEQTTGSVMSSSGKDAEKALSWLWRGDVLRSDDLVYIHSRAQGLPASLGSLMGILAWLRGRDRERTVIVPTFPFAGGEYADYLARRPRFSVRSTPARTGLLPEIARSLPGAVRSAHPLLSECALGERADSLMSSTHCNPHPFHPTSTYTQMIEANAVMLGLGVDIGVNALIHWVDDRLKERYDFAIFEPEPVDFEVEFADGAIGSVTVLPYSPAMTKRIKPRMIRPIFAERADALVEGKLDGVPFYRLRLRPFLEACLAAGKAALDDGRLPPWYPE